MSHFKLFIAFFFFPGPLAFLFLLLRYISSINIRAGFRRCQFPPPSYEEATRGGAEVGREGGGTRVSWAAEPEREGARARRWRRKEETWSEGAAPPTYDAASF